MKFDKVEVLEWMNPPMMLWNPKILSIWFETEGFEGRVTGTAYLMTKRGWVHWLDGQSIKQVLEEFNG